MRNPFQVDEDQADEWRQKFKELVQPHVDEEVVAAGPFRRGGAAGQYALSKAGGGIPYAIGALFRKKQAGGLPQRVFLVVTPTKLHAFDFGLKGRQYKIRDEAAVWDRAAPDQHREEAESDDADDRVARRGREGDAGARRRGRRSIQRRRDCRPRWRRHSRGRSEVTIHKRRGGGYWYYWVIIIGGTAFVIAYIVTDGFGLSA